MPRPTLAGAWLARTPLIGTAELTRRILTSATKLTRSTWARGSLTRTVLSRTELTRRALTRTALTRPELTRTARRTLGAAELT